MINIFRLSLDPARIAALDLTESGPGVLDDKIRAAIARGTPLDLPRLTLARNIELRCPRPRLAIIHRLDHEIRRQKSLMGKAA